MHLVDLKLFLFRVPETLPLYDILNEFQKGHSHMAVVVRQFNKPTTKSPASGKPFHNKVTYLAKIALVKCSLRE